MTVDHSTPTAEPRAPQIVPNRAMRRALASNSPSNPVFKDYALTEAAFRLLCRNLEMYGNRLTEEHRAALMTILHRFTMLANGSVIGRYAYDLPCGGGKTQGIVAWAATAIRMRRRYSVSVCASKVEALCELKRDLLANGVPEREIGLLHSYRFDPEIARAFLEEGRAMPEGFASLPATDDNQLRQVLLVTHSRVRGRDKEGRSSVERYNVYRGKRRDLVIWDESLLVADHRVVETLDIKKGLGYLAPEAKLDNATADLVAVVAYVRGALAKIEQERLEQQEHKRAPSIIFLDPLETDQLAAMIAALPNRKSVDKDATAPVRELLEVSQSPLRVVPDNNGGGTVQYEIAVPPELRSVAVLDASWAIRSLERLDKSLGDDPLFCGDVKRYDAVTVHQLRHAAGRGAMNVEFLSRKEDREITREVVEVVRAIPETEAVLFFTFKARGKFDHAEKLKEALKASGVDLEAKIPVTAFDPKTGRDETTRKPRLVWATFGQETSMNTWKHCSNVIFAGVLHRSTVELSGAMLGQLDNLTAPLEVPDVLAIRTSEVCHVLLQGINRAACRDTINGEAKATRVWLLYPDTTIRPALEKAMPGLRWTEWEPKYMEAPTGRIAGTAKKIEEYLKGLPSETRRVSSRKLKADTGLSDLPPRTVGHALANVALAGWRLEGRSWVRT